MLFREKYYDTIALMLRKNLHIGRIAYLFLYALYALTPVQMYAMSGRGLPHTGTHVPTDIVWVNVLFSSTDDDDDTASTGSLVSAGARQSGDVVLVMKRRTLGREQFNVKPPLDTKILPAVYPEHPSAWLSEHEIAKDPLAREVVGCFTLKSGLSPPFFLS